MLDFLQGPIWTSDPETGKPQTGIPMIDNDSVIQSISHDIQEMYFGYFHFDTDDEACWFDENQERKDKRKMLAMLKQLNNRLNEINDGSFTVEDLETPRVRKL